MYSVHTIRREVYIHLYMGHQTNIPLKTHPMVLCIQSLEIVSASLTGTYHVRGNTVCAAGKWQTAVWSWLVLIGTVYAYLICDNLDLHTLE